MSDPVYILCKRVVVGDGHRRRRIAIYVDKRYSRAATELQTVAKGKA